MLHVTAIVPTSDRPILLERALRSVAAQELVPSELIVVDDASEGHEAVTRRAVEQWGLGPVQVVANSRAKGAGGARNTGAELANGEVLAFLDDDDEWLPSYLAEAVHAFGSRELDVMCADLLCQFDDGVDRPSKKAPDSLAPELFLTRNPGLIGSNIIIRRSLYREIGGFNETLPTCNDRDFGIRLGLHGGVRYEALRKRLVRHYQHRKARLCMPKSDAMCTGIRRFYEIHSHRMTETQRKAFRENVRFFWGIDEAGEIVHSPPAPIFEPLLPLLKARLDEKRRQVR
jgi:glycosyltransferase involved in cell wall biosynthesis